MIDNPHKEAMRRAVVRLLQQQRLRTDSETSSATESAISTLAFLAQLYIGSLARSSKHFAELAGRSKANAIDVAQSLEENQVSIEDLLAFAQDSVEGDARPASSSAQDLAADIDDPVFYEYVEVPEDYDQAESYQLPESHDSDDVEPLSDSLIFPSPTPQEMLVNRIPLPIVLEDVLNSPDNPQPSDLPAQEEAKPDAASPINNVPAIEVVGKPAPEEATEIWRSLLKRRQGRCQAEADKNSRPLYADHDELYRASYSSLKRKEPDFYSPGDNCPLGVGVFAPEPPSGNKATINHTITPYQTPITPLFYNSVLSSFLPKFLTSAAQPLQPEEQEQLGRAPLPSWVSLPEPEPEPEPVPIAAPVAQRTPVMRIVAKVASPVASPATLIKIKLPKKDKELAGTPTKRKPRTKAADKLPTKPKPLAKSRKPYDMAYKFKSKALLSKAAKSGLTGLAAPPRKLLETPKLTSQGRDAPERSTSSNEGLSSPSPDTQPDFPNGNHEEWHNGTCEDDRPKIKLKFKVPSPKETTPKVVLRLPPQSGIREQNESSQTSLDMSRGFSDRVPGAINCFCPEYSTDHGKLMVSCDSCTQWFHGDCVHMLNKEDLPAEWYCDRCLQRPFETKPHKRPKHHHASEDDIFNQPTSPRGQRLGSKW